jgi:hypothetical protein
VEYALDGGAFTPYTAPVVVNQVGMHMVHYRATDVAGNVSPEGMAHFTVVAPPVEDTTPPTVSAAVTGIRDPAGSYVGTATVTITATDTESGVSTVEFALDGGAFASYTAPVVVSAVGDHTVQYRATDRAGNVSAIGSVSFRVVAPPVEDTTPPAVSAAVSGTRDANGNYVGAATVTITATDTQSGVSTVEYSLDGAAFTRYTAPVAVSQVGAHSVRYRATDVAGNVSPENGVMFSVVAQDGDACPNSDTRGTVIIGTDDTGVANLDTGNGCTINDLIAEHAAYPDHGAFVRHVEAVTNPLVASGLLSRRNQGTIVRAAARSSVGT